MLVFDAREVLQALIHLNQWEDEIKTLGPRTQRRTQLETSIAAERPKVAPFILAHHDRIRARGKSSTAPVRDWICRSCYISVPIGLRTKLSARDDICVCENCGAYIFLPTPEQQTQIEEAEARKRQAAQSRSEKATVSPTAPPARKSTGAAPRPRSKATPVPKKKSPVRNPRPKKAATARRPAAKKSAPSKTKRVTPKRTAPTRPKPKAKSRRS